jgi:alpha-glucoside transport system permease protein
LGSGASLTAEPPFEGAPQDAGGDAGGGRGYGTVLLFLGPAAFFLIVWIVYPTVYTFGRSFFGLNGFNNFVGIDNYQTIVTTPVLRTAIKNNAVWVAVVPALVTAIGLIFAVLTERIRWSVAFKTAVFMPMAISLFATGVIWRLMDQKDPNQGTVNAIISVFYNAVNPPGTLEDALPATSTLVGSAQQGFVLKTPVQPGGTALLALTGIPPGEVPSGATQAVVPPPKPGSVGGVVWRDFKPGGGTPGKVEPGEVGLPGVELELRDASGKTVDTITSEDDGAFEFAGVSSGSYRVAINKQTFQPAFRGINWLGPKLITPSIMIAYIWVWAGFSMVVIAAGLAAIPRDTLEAARTDGATEWQIFRRITVPLLAPVLSVVFITMLINVLKVFDIVLSVAPGSTQSDATVIALQMWRTSFGGVNDFGVGSAIAVFLFVLVIPVLALNVRRFRREV